MSVDLSNFKSLQQAVVYFSDKDRAFDFIVKMRWPNGVTCSHCGHDKVGFVSTRRVFKCKHKECRKHFSIKSGTIMEDSPLGLD